MIRSYAPDDEETDFAVGSSVDGEDKSRDCTRARRKSTFSEIILTRDRTKDSENGKQALSNAFNRHVEQWHNTQTYSELQNRDLSSKFSRMTSIPHNPHHGSNYQEQTSLENDDNAGKRGYILAVATVPGGMSGKFKFDQSQAKQKSLLDPMIVVKNGINQLSILIDLDIEHQVLLRDGFSDTEKWGPEPNFYVEVFDPENIVRGVGALLGKIFHQDAIGITHPLTENDRRRLNSNQGEPWPEDYHLYYTVHPISPIPRNTAFEIIKYLRQFCPELSGQLDTSGNSIEFHDFGSSSNCTSAKIELTLTHYFHQKFEVETGFIKSTLLEKCEYKQALDDWDTRLSQMVSCMKVADAHAISYCEPPQRNARCCIL